MNKLHFRPPHPGEIISEVVLPATKLNMSKLADKLGLSRQRLHSIIASHKPVTRESALKLAAFCGNRPEDWLRWQHMYDFYTAGASEFISLGKIRKHSKLIIQPNNDAVWLQVGMKEKEVRDRSKKYIDKGAALKKREGTKIFFRFS